MRVLALFVAVLGSAAAFMPAAPIAARVNARSLMVRMAGEFSDKVRLRPPSLQLIGLSFGRAAFELWADC